MYLGIETSTWILSWGLMTLLVSLLCLKHIDIHKNKRSVIQSLAVIAIWPILALLAAIIVAVITIEYLIVASLTNRKGGILLEYMMSRLAIDKIDVLE